MIELIGLSAFPEEKQIIKNVNLEIKDKEIHAVLGPNGSGKSTLAKAIMGLVPTKGKIIFKNKDISKLPPEKRSKKGIFLAFQQPPEIEGIETRDFLKTIGKHRSKKIKKMDKEHLMKRELNKGFSGGEKKLSEIFQLVSMDPEFIILDEVDSGLDIMNLKMVSKILRKMKKSMLIITHHGSILEYLEPDQTHVMVDGEIKCSGEWEEIWETIEEEGYDKCRTCQVSSD